MCAMGPPGGGRNPVTTRLLRHFNFLSFPEMEDPSKHKIFATILHSWIGNNGKRFKLLLQGATLFSWQRTAECFFLNTGQRKGSYRHKLRPHLETMTKMMVLNYNYEFLDGHADFESKQILLFSE